MRSKLATPGLLGLPLAWLLVFFLIPIGIVGAYSVDALHGPEIFARTHEVTLSAWSRFFHSSVYLGLFWKSVKMSLIVSALVAVGALLARTLRLQEEATEDSGTGSRF